MPTGLRLSADVLHKILRTHSERWVFQVRVDVLIKLSLLRMNVVLLARIYVSSFQLAFIVVVGCSVMKLNSIGRTWLLWLLLRHALRLVLFELW